MMQIAYAALSITALILSLPAHAAAPTRMRMSVKVTARMSSAINLRTEKLRRQIWRPSRIAYGRVISTTSLMTTARTVIDAQQSLTARRATSATADAEYHRLRHLYALHANVSHRQVQSARSRWQSDQAALQKAKMALMAARSAARVEWGPVVSSWLAPDSRHLHELAAGDARLIRLTLPGRTRITTPKQPVTLVTIDRARIPATWISVAPTSGPGLQGISFYVWASQATSRLAYGAGVVGRIPHGPAMDGVLVPRTAVIWSGSSAWVFVHSDAGAYRREPVATRYPTGDGWFEPNIPTPGDVIVTHGAQVLLSIQQMGASSPPSGKHHH